MVGVAGCHPDLLPELVALAVRGELDVAGAAAVVTLDGLAAAVDARATTTAPTALVVDLR
ncbi:MAG: hypothetical protein H6708_23195 [Kofleriaceae bacterium]|nr:hypothetical protein [Kofleriaceae bacterium]